MTLTQSLRTGSNGLKLSCGMCSFLGVTTLTDGFTLKQLAAHLMSYKHSTLMLNPHAIRQFVSQDWCD